MLADIDDYLGCLKMNSLLETGIEFGVLTELRVICKILPKKRVDARTTDSCAKDDFS